MRKGRKLKLDPINLKILEIVSNYPEGIYFGRLADIFSGLLYGKKLSRIEKHRLKSMLYGRVERLAKYGYLQKTIHQGLLWVKLNFTVVDELNIRKKDKRANNRAGKNNIHHYFITRCFLGLLENLSFHGLKCIWDLKTEYYHHKRVITFNLGFGPRRVRYAIRIYGYNEPLTLAHVKRDKDLFEHYKDYKIIVISTSYVEKKAEKFLRKLGVEKIYTLNINPRNYGDPRKFKQYWDYRRKYYPELPRNPPKIVSKGEFINRVRSITIRGLQKLIADLFLVLKKASRFIRELEVRLYRMRMEYFRKLREGDIRGARTILLGLDLIKEYLKAGLPPPSI